MTTPQSSPSDNTSALRIDTSGAIEQNVSPPKIDEITAVQDSIDRLSLAMFEALRGLRDAVAPESGNLTASSTNATSTSTTETSDADFDDFYHSYRHGDEKTLELVKKASGGVLPQRREDLIRLHAKMEMEKDTELVARLASAVLQKSAEIDERMAALPGMHRTRTQQMKRIEELVKSNQQAAMDLDIAYKLAHERRDEVRTALKEQTTRALGIEGE